MSESSGEKTEDATPKKLRDARQKGQVASSKDLPPALIMLVAAAYFWAVGSWLMEEMIELFVVIPYLQTIPFGQAISATTTLVLKIVVGAIILPFVGLMAITAMVSNIVQFGIVFSFDPILPKLSKISPASGFKRIFSVKQLVNTVFSLFKTIVISIALGIVVWIGMKSLIGELKQCNVSCQTAIVADLFLTLMMFVIPLMITMAILDFLFQKIQFAKEQRMTKEEIKREMKDMFGDPHVRGARDSIRREMNAQDIKARIKTARLLVIDIGRAVALHYEQDVTPLPLIVAIGKDGMARKMIEIAQIERVPVVTDAKLVAGLIEEGKIDQYIPTSTIDLVARAMRRTSK